MSDACFLFATQQIAAWTRNIQFPDKRFPLIVAGDGPYVPPTEPRKRFIHTCVWMAPYLATSRNDAHLNQVPFSILNY